jgi:hypothetical protein
MKLNIKKWVISSIAVYITFEILNMLIHGLILGKEYTALANIWRPEMMDIMWVMSIANLIFSFFFVFIFSKGYEGHGIIEGIRYGLIIGLFINIFSVLNQYVIYPLPLNVAIQWLLFNTLQMVVCGIVASLVYKPSS